MKNMNFPWAGELHGRAGRQAALQDRPVGCTLSWAAEKGGPEGCPFLQPTPPFSADRLFVQPAGPPFCLLCSPPAPRKFTFFIWKHSPPACPALQSVLSLRNGLTVACGHFCSVCRHSC